MSIFAEQRFDYCITPYCKLRGTMRHSRIASRIQPSRSCRNAALLWMAFHARMNLPLRRRVHSHRGGRTRSSRSDEIGHRLSDVLGVDPYAHAREYAWWWWWRWRWRWRQRRRWKLFVARYNASILCRHPFSGYRILFYFCIVRMSLPDNVSENSFRVDNDWPWRSAEISERNSERPSLWY